MACNCVKMVGVRPCTVCRRPMPAALGSAHPRCAVAARQGYGTLDPDVLEAATATGGGASYGTAVAAGLTVVGVVKLASWVFGGRR